MSRASPKELRRINAEALARCARCPQCGYQLEGLPDRGLCPECGFAYSPELVVLYGTGEGGKRTGRGKALSFAYVVAIAVAMILLDRIPYHRNWIMPAVLVGFGIVFDIYRRMMRADMPAETQLRLSPEGFAQRDGLGEVKLTPWTRHHKVELASRWLGSGYILKIRGRATRFIFFHPVQFAFEADQQTAHELRLRIRDYRRMQAGVAR